MSLKAAVEFLRGALVGSPSQVYVFHDGWAYASGRAATAAYPVPEILGTFGLAAADLGAAVGKMKSEPEVSAGDGTIVLRSGRLRSTIDLFEAEPSEPFDVDAASDPVPARLVAALVAVGPFLSAEGTWQRGADMETGAVRGINAASACRVEVPGLEMGFRFALTDEALAHLVSQEEPVGWTAEPASLTFLWASGARSRYRAMAHQWAAVAENVFKLIEHDCPVEIGDEWREAFAEVSALGEEGHIDVTPEGIVARSAHAEHVAAFPTGVSGTTRWKTKALAGVIKVATSWDPDTDGPAAFRGDRLRGVVMRIRK